MRAVFKTGGKQYRVEQGAVISVEKCLAAVGDRIEVGPLLLFQNDDQVIIDADQLKDSKAVCEVIRQGRAKKIVVFKKKRRKNYRKTQGHRQSFTRLKVVGIVSGQAADTEAPPQSLTAN